MSNQILNETLIQTTLISLFDCVLPAISTTEYRVVGTAATLLHGIGVAARDIDLLFNDRQGIDLFHKQLSASSGIVQHQPPAWLAGSRQYFARYTIEGVTVELSTVEFEVDRNNDTLECVGRGPWEHFDPIACGPYQVATVALELRLLTELSRNRPEQYQPILKYLRIHPYDVDLVRRGLAAHAIPQQQQHTVLALIAPTPNGNTWRY
jgi:hypothetical protein